MHKNQRFFDLIFILAFSLTVFCLFFGENHLATLLVTLICRLIRQEYHLCFLVCDVVFFRTEVGHHGR